jgi:hypothetical protein
MVQDVDILHSVSNVLNNEFNYGSFIEENNKEVLIPTFFLSLSHLTTDPYKYWNEKLINVYIEYTNKAVKIEESLTMQDNLDNLFDMYIEVDDRKLILDKKKFIRNKDFITMVLTLNYFDDKTSIPCEDKSTGLMENLNLNINEE